MMPRSSHASSSFAIALLVSLVAGCGNSGNSSGTGGNTGGSGGATGGSAGAGGTAGAGGMTGSGGSGGSGGGGPMCGTSGWVTYGHDGQRTSASDGCVGAMATIAWSYTPVPPDGKKVSRLWQPVATPDATYLHWAATIDPYIGTTAADRIDAKGERVWTFDSGSDANLGDWPTLWKDTLVLNADGVYMLDSATGKSTAGTGVDWWGQTIPTDGALLLSNTSKSDGPGLFVATLDAKAQVLWKQNEQGTMCGQSFADQTGGIALDGTTLFYAPRYATGSAMMPPFASGVYAFDTTAMGKQLWTVPTTPQSAVSAADGLVFLVEQAMAGMTALVARKQKDGSVAWSQPLMGGASGQAPAIADGLVIVGTFGGVMAFGEMDGAPKWKAMMPTGYAAPAQLSVNNGCGGLQPLGNLPDTAIAVARGSGTVLVTDQKDIVMLKLATGEAAGKLSPDGVMGQLADPIVVGSRVYVVERNFPGDKSRLIALDTK
jgi:hypothetical protein